MSLLLILSITIKKSIAEVTNNGRPMNPSLSEDSVADTAISKRNSDGMFFLVFIFVFVFSQNVETKDCFKAIFLLSSSIRSFTNCDLIKT